MHHLEWLSVEFKTATITCTVISQQASAGAKSTTNNFYNALFACYYVLCTKSLLIALWIICLLPCDWTTITCYVNICQKISSQIVPICCLIVVIYFVSIKYKERWVVNLPILQYIPRNMHTVFALLCFVVVIHWLIFPYPSGLLHWHCGNLTIAPVPAKQPWWIWINTSCEFIMNDCITTTKQSTTKPCAYFLGYTVVHRVIEMSLTQC